MAAVGRLEQARTVVDGARERAARMPEQFALEEGFGDRAAVDGDERASRAGGFVVHQLRDEFLARPAFARDQDGGIHLRDALGEIDHPPHGGASGDDPERVHGFGGHPGEHAPLLPELLLGLLEVRGDQVQRGFEPFLEVLDAVEAEFLGPFVPPFLDRAGQEVARGVAASHAALLEHVDLLAHRTAQVPARDAADGPADRVVAPAQVGDVLFRFVRADERQAFLGQRTVSPRPQVVHAAEHVDAPARLLPVVLALPLEHLLRRRGHAPALDVAEAGQDGPGGGGTEVVDQLLAQVPLRRGVEDERALTREADHATLSIELHQFADIEIFDMHGGTSLLIDSTSK